MSLLEAAFLLQGTAPSAEFEPKRMKRAMRTVGQVMRKDARRLVARRAVSAPGAFPGRVTGDLLKSVRFKLSRSGWSVKVASYRTEAMKAKDTFYPAILIHGSAHLAPRGDYIEATYQARQDWVREQVSSSLLDGVELK